MFEFTKHQFQLIQVEAVGERVKPVTLKVGIYEKGHIDQPVTNIETVTFDSVSEKMDERKKWVALVLRDQAYDKKADYRLVLLNLDSDGLVQSVQVVIDRAIHDDF